MTKRLLGLGAAVVACGVVFGCDKGAATDAGAAVGNAAEKTGVAVDNAAEKTGEKMAEAGNKMAETGNKMANAVADFTSDASMATSVTPRIKTAILADKTLADAKNTIDIDSKDRIVHIKGNVASNDLKRKAAEIAKSTLTEMSAPADIKVSNELVVK